MKEKDTDEKFFCQNACTVQKLCLSLQRQKSFRRHEVSRRRSGIFCARTAEVHLRKENSTTPGGVSDNDPKGLRLNEP